MLYKVDCRQARPSSNNSRNCLGITKRPLIFTMSLLKKRENSVMATDLEHQQEGETFRVVDSPSLPSTPSFPKKSVFLGGGVGAGLALSLGILYLLALSDKALYSERDVEVCLKLPVLAAVPSFDVRGHSHHHKTKDTPKYDGELVAKA